MTTTKQLVTADELLAMPDDGFRYELVRGELTKMPPGGFEHSTIAANITMRLGPHVKDNGIGKVGTAEPGFLLESDHVRVPDVAFVRQGRIDTVADVRRFFPGPPDIAFEVVSPNDRYTEVDEKVADYLAAGTLAVVVVDPRRRTVKVHRSLTEVEELGEGDTLEVGDMVPGWQMAVREIFE